MARMNQAMSDLVRYDGALLSQRRSTFFKEHSHTTTLDSGYLVPLMVDRVLPGDEKKIYFNGLARMNTPLHPVMDQAFQDVWCFYVPDRLWYGHAKEFYGENKDAEFNPDGEYMLPYLKPSQYCVDQTDTVHFTGLGSLNDYFGYPVVSHSVALTRDNDARNYISAGNHRAYQLIWNEWFRNSSVQPSLRLSVGDTVTNEEWDVIKQIRQVNKLPDYFTTALKDPQNGPDVLLPLSDYVPVHTLTDTIYSSSNTPTDSLLWANVATGMHVDETKFLVHGEDGHTYINGNKSDGSSELYELAPNNLWANLTSSTQSTINNLRMAITAQHLFEIQNSSGKRYQQIIHGLWGVLTPDATLQRPELLGSSRTELGMRTVVQTSESTDSSPLGNLAAFSVTNTANKLLCDKSFTEPGIIMIVGAIRPVVSYSQGINPLWTHLTPMEQYNPVFDGLGNQPIYGYELYNGDNATEDARHGVFGYKPAWDEYRVMNNRVSGLMRPDVNGTLSSWNYSLAFDDMPLLDNQFMLIDPDFIDRTLAVQNQPQFILDCAFTYYDTRSMSMHSKPGLSYI